MTPLISLYGNVLGVLDHRTTLIFLHVGFSISMAVFIYHGFIKSSVLLALEKPPLLGRLFPHRHLLRVVFPLLKTHHRHHRGAQRPRDLERFPAPSLILWQTQALYPAAVHLRFYGTYSVDYGAIMAALAHDHNSGHHSVYFPAKADHQRRDRGCCENVSQSIDIC